MIDYAFLTLLMLLSSCCVANSQENDCPCNNALSGAAWGSILRAGVCIGKCDVAFRNDTWSCITSDNRTLTCSRVSECTISRTCEGEWGPWGSVGPCITPCGFGIQRQERPCYKIMPEASRNVRNNFCLGGRGNSSQEQIVQCKKRDCQTSSEVATTRSAKAIETSSAPLINLIYSTKRTEETKTSEDLEEPPTLDTPALAAILGSVGLLCVAVIVVACIVVRRRKAAKPKIPNSIISNSSYASGKPNEDFNQYEIVPPALPSRQVMLRSESPGHFNRISSAHLISSQSSEILRSSRDMSLRSSLNNSVGVYLEALPSPTTRSLAGGEINEDATYMSID